MKKVSSFLVVVFLYPCLAFPQELIESIYVVAQENRTALPPERCNWALKFLGGMPLLSSTRSDLYSLKIKDKDGSVTKSKKPVGVLVGCTSEGIPEYERVDYLTLGLGEIWKMHLHGKNYTVTGSNRLRTNPFVSPYGFPVPNTGMFLATGTGTIHKPFETHWPRVVVGSFSTNYVYSEGPAEGFNPDLLSIVTIRLYE